MTDTSTAPTTAGPGRPHRRPWLITGALVAVVAIAVGAFGWWQWVGRPLTQHETHQQTYALSGGAIVIDASRGEGNILLVPGNSGEVVVDRKVGWDRQKPSVTEAWTGDTLRITVDCPKDRPLYDYYCEVTNTIRIPVNAAVRVYSRVGDITSRGIAGDLNVESDTGDINVDSAAGALVVKSETGMVRLTEARAREVDLRLGTGDVYGTFLQAPRNITANVGTGNLYLDVPNNESYDVKAGNGAGGGEQAIGLQQRADAPHTIVAHVGTGDLHLR